MCAVSKDLALFFVFLAQEGVTDRFFENWVFRDLHSRGSSDIVASFTLWVQIVGIDWDSYFISAFLWSSSPEGEDYWSALNSKWLSYCGTVCK